MFFWTSSWTVHELFKLVFKFHGNIQIFLIIFELVLGVFMNSSKNLNSSYHKFFFSDFKNTVVKGTLTIFRRKKQLICHRHVDDLRNEKKLIQYVGRETDSLIQNWLIPTEYHLRCNCSKQFEFIMYPSVMLRLFYEPPMVASSRACSSALSRN
jgi:hypothetical protein